MVGLVKNYIDGHLGDGLSLEALGSVVHLHPVYLSKLYKQETGENLSSYILRARLEKSAHLLEASNLHVMDIARMVGYQKPQYIIKLFKELYGITRISTEGEGSASPAEQTDKLLSYLLSTPTFQ